MIGSESEKAASAAKSPVKRGGSERGRIVQVLQGRKFILLQVCVRLLFCLYLFVPMLRLQNRCTEKAAT
jgi:hypothetical protein